MSKPYQQVPIVDCGEPLVPIPLERFALEQPHPYVKLGAPYGDKSPYYLRLGVLQRLAQAQRSLQQTHPGWRIQIFDAYRPLAVQQYMVDYTFAQLTAAQGLSPAELTAAQRQDFLEQVYQFWAVPSYDPTMPPPHSTGAAVDVTLVDAGGAVVNMGSPIDEMSPRSYPDYFAEANVELDDNSVAEGDRLTFHSHRQLLKRVMTAAEFRQHPREWWHFSFGDQLWTWLTRQNSPADADSLNVRKNSKETARYGAI